MIRLRQSTASQEVPLGYFVSSTDGDTAQTGLTIANTDIKIWVSGATTLANKNSGGATHIANGVYYCVLDATDTATVGPLVLFVKVSGALAVRVPCEVLAANVYDVLFGTTALSTYAGADTSGTTTLLSRIGSALTITSGRVTANTDQLAGQTVTAAAGVTFPASVGTSTLTQTQVTGGAYALNSASFAFNSALDFTTTQKTSIGTAVAASAVASVTGNVGGSVGSVTGNVGGNVVGSVASIATGGITSASFAANSITAAAIAADAIGASELAADAVAEIQNGLSTLTQANVADAVWNAATASYGTTGSYGLLVETNLDAAVSTRSTYAGADTSGTTTLLGLLTATRAGYLDNLSGGAVALASGVTVTTNNDKTGYSLTQSFPANFAALAVTAAGKVTVGTNDDKTGYSLSQSFPTNFSSLAITSGGAVTAGTVSDKTGYSLAGTPSVNVTQINSVTLTGVGTSGDPWGPI